MATTVGRLSRASSSARHRQATDDDNREKKGVDDGAMRHVFEPAVGKCDHAHAVGATVTILVDILEVGAKR